MSSDVTGPPAPRRADPPPLRIAVESLNAVHGGTVIVAQCLVAEMARQRPQHHFVSYFPVEQVAEYDYPENVELVHIPQGASMPRRLWWENRRLPKLLSSGGYQALVCLSGFAVVGTDLPQISVWQNPNTFARDSVPRPWWTRAYLGLKRAGQKYSMARVAHNVFLSEESVEMAKSRWPMDRWPHGVIYNGIDLLRTRDDFPPEESREHFALTVGYTYFHKNYENMIDAMALYRDRYPECGLGLKIIGGGDRRPEYYAGLERRIRDLGLSDRVEMLGARGADEVVDHYRRAKAYVVTSLLETFGLTTLEAMSHGLPVLVPDATCFPEVCADAALYCDPVDPADIADKLHRVVYDLELRETVRRNGLERLDFFSWERSAAKYLDQIERIAQPAAGPVG